MAKAPKPRAIRKRQGLLITLDDDSWEFDVNEVSPKDVRDLRKATGVSLQELLKAVSSGGLDLDLAAGLVMLARRQSEGQWVTFDHVSETMTYGSKFELGSIDDDDENPEKDADSPEA